MAINLNKKWTRFWMRFSGISRKGRIATRLATINMPPFYSRVPLSKIYSKGYVSPDAIVHHTLFTTGKHIYIDNNTLIYQDKRGGAVVLGDGVHLHRDIIIQTGAGGSVSIGPFSHIQPRCHFSAYKGPIKIGKSVEIAPNCAFYSYDHGTKPDIQISQQPLTSKGGIVIEDNAWLGFGCIVLDGVTIGTGAVLGAGSVVTNNIPADAIAAGVPARVLKKRTDML